MYLILNDVAHMRPVKPGVTEGENTQVEGINPGDVVANNGFEKLQDNSKITITKKVLLPSNNESDAP